MTVIDEAEAERILQRVAERMADDMMAALVGAGAFTNPRPTALRLTPSGAFEVAELGADGTIIEPPKRCPKCGPILLCAEHMAMIT